MLKKKERLTTKQFDRFFKSGKRVHTKNMQLVHTPDDVFHASVVVGKKVWKSAVKRNRLRRQIYTMLYTQNVSQKLTGVYICIMKPSAKDLSFQELKDDLLGALKQFEKQSHKR